MTFYKRGPKDKGFTLVETLVAVSILVVAVTGAYSAAQTGLSSATFSKDEVIAFYLAQESVEGIRNFRDANALKHAPSWLSGIADTSGDPCYPADGHHACMIDPLTATLSSCNGDVAACQIVKQDPATGFYGYDSSWTDTPFQRAIVLNTVNSNEVSITVSVSWHKGIVQRTFKVRENILNWQSQ
jgi:prepilin-type N-terminal cleavage/methylation domain-containing protein